MRKFRDFSIKRKLMLIILMTGGVALLLACVAFAAYELITFRQAMIRDLSILAEVIGTNSTAALVFNDQNDAKETLSALKAEPHIVAACIYTKEGKMFAKYLRHATTDTDTDTDRDFLFPEPQKDGHRFSNRYLALFRRVILDNEPVGIIYIQSDLEKMYSRLKRYAAIAIMVMSASSFVAFLLSSRLQQVISKPILHLAQMAKVVSVEKDYSVRAVKHSQDEIGLLIEGFNEMLSQIQRRDEILQNLAYHDPLTKLPNRLMFKENLSREIERAKRNNQRLAVMFLDLDRFKTVNDSLGHEPGDQFLEIVSQRLVRFLRESDLVARLGGDEFTILLANLPSIEDAVSVAQRAVESFKQPWRFGGHEFHITTSIGIAIYPNDGEDAETLLKHADIAMYRVKEGGRDNYQFYNPTMSAKILERLDLETSLRQALENKEFVLHYHPLIDINTSQISSVEALLYWQHANRGLLQPDEFVQLAEESGLILPIGEWVLHTVCLQNKSWQKSVFPPMSVTVNLSGRQFKQRNLVETIAQILKETGLEANWLELEITEGVAMEDIDYTVTILQTLKGMGIRILIDDFGSGYSSLNYLKQLPINGLKIDKSFIRNVISDPNDAAIVETIIVLAKNLGLRVIAEGVETENQLAFLKQKQCDEMQGYLFSKPLPAEEFEKILRKVT